MFSLASPRHVHVARTAIRVQTTTRRTRTAASWSGSLSFSSPESDFSSSRDYSISSTATTTGSIRVQQPTSSWSNTLSFASPESDFTAAAASTSPAAAASTTVRFPQSFAEALTSPLACVVTTTAAPHRIVSVNPAWETLCGYQQQEVLHRTLGFLQGQATNQTLVQHTVRQATTTTMQTNAPNKEWVDMYVVNYTKQGSPFTNHVSIKTVPLTNDGRATDVLDPPQFLLGVLEPVEKSPLRMIMGMEEEPCV